jgi:hypothetical protein
VHQPDEVVSLALTELHTFVHHSGNHVIDTIDSLWKKKPTIGMWIWEKSGHGAIIRANHRARQQLSLFFMR